VAVGLFSYKMIDTHRAQSIEDATRWASDLSGAVKRSTKYDMLKGEEGREALHYTIDAIGAREGIEKVRIFSSEGKIMFSTDKGEVGKILDKEREQCYACHAPEKPLEKLDLPNRSRIIPKTKEHDYRILGIINPIYNEKDCFSCHSEDQKVLGVLDFEISLAEVDAETKKNFFATLFFTFITILLVSVGIGLFIYGAVSRPIKRMVIGTKKIAEGDLDYTIPLNTHDEIGILANSFNKMTKDLKRANSELQEWSRTLEKKVEDRTELLKAAQEQLIQSEKLASLGQLAAGVAHEVNNPLAGILVYIKLLLKKYKENNLQSEETEKQLLKIERETDRSSRIIRNLLDFSRQSEPTLRPVDLNKVVQATLSIVGHQISLDNITLEMNLDQQLPLVLADFDQIQQALINVILNATQAMPDGGNLKITTSIAESIEIGGSTKNTVRIDVSDTGVGIPKENLNKLFTPFFTTKEKGKGVGLGLAALHGIIERHRGKIEVDSKPNIGTTFKIYLEITDEGKGQDPRSGR
ncbi:MAG: HAMP domain-containing protein, partial [Deltaproteobacteria bacterium]